MVQHSPLTAEAIEVFLEETLEAEFSFLRLDELIARLEAAGPDAADRN